MNISSSATLMFNAGAQITSTGGSLSINNAGVMRVSAPESSVQIDVPVVNTGLIAADFGKLFLNGTYTQTGGQLAVNSGAELRRPVGQSLSIPSGGLLTGDGLVTADVVNAGPSGWTAASRPPAR